MCDASRTTASFDVASGELLAGFCEAMRDILKECRLEYTRLGANFHGRDGLGIVSVQCDMPADAIERDGGSYVCARDVVEVGIDTKMLAKCLCSVSAGDTVGLNYDAGRDPDRLMVRCYNRDTGKRSAWDIITPEPPQDPVARLKITDCRYNAELSISSSLFHDVVRDLTKTDATGVRVYCDGERLVLCAAGRHMKASFEMYRGQPGGFEYRPGPSDLWPVCECYSLVFAQKVAKAKGASPVLHMHMTPDFPIAFTYNSAIGTLSYIITPQYDDEWLENASVRIMPPPMLTDIPVTCDKRARTDRERAPVAKRGNKKRKTMDASEDEGTDGEK